MFFVVVVESVVRFVVFDLESTTNTYSFLLVELHTNHKSLNSMNNRIEQLVKSLLLFNYFNTFNDSLKPFFNQNTFDIL